MKKNENKRSATLSLTLILAGIIFIIMLVTMILVTATLLSLFGAGVIELGELRLGATTTIVWIGVVSVVLGTLLSFAAGKFALVPLNRVIKAMNRLASGDFKTRLNPSKFWSQYSSVDDFSTSFNTMASELEHTELLRADFVNSFSHEFKTPIVSISGFAKLLRSGNLTPEEQQEYATIIEKESLRLAQMATSVLNYSKIENQEILSDVSTYNLSEQLRECFLLLEKGWSSKNLNLVLDFGEYDIIADKKLMEQVWINIIDNAVKFSDDAGEIKVLIDEIEYPAKAVSVEISNTGSTINPENYDRIFTKFFQEDKNHTSSGNGIGLAMAKKICTLHGGDISASSENNETTFRVIIPQAIKS